ncbi:MAG: tRNA-binding protein [Thermoplasmata archaeon]
MKTASVKTAITIGDFEKLDIRVGTIERVENLPHADTLVRLAVDFGDRTRTVLAGMKQEREDPKKLEGRQALFVVNLEPREIMGEESEPMLLDIGYPDGLRPVLAVPEEPVPNGARAA